MTAWFMTAHDKLRILQCYAPPNDHDDTPKDQFYQWFQDLVNNTSHHDIIILISDMNAKIGGDRSVFEHVSGPHAYRKCTNNGNCFIQFCMMNNLKIGSTLFQHKDIHKITWVSNDHKTVTLIDHLALEPGRRTLCLKDVKVHCGADICSDHRLVTAKVKIKLKKRKKGKQIPRWFDISRLWEPVTWRRFQTMLQNRFTSLEHNVPGSTEW